VTRIKRDINRVRLVYQPDILNMKKRSYFNVI
jgi:hypothetical protein